MITAIVSETANAESSGPSGAEQTDCFRPTEWWPDCDPRRVGHRARLPGQQIGRARGGRGVSHCCAGWGGSRQARGECSAVESSRRLRPVRAGMLSDMTWTDTQRETVVYHRSGNFWRVLQ